MFRSSCVLSLAGSVVIASGQVTYPRGAIWVFGNHGLSIFNSDGSKLLKSMPPEDFCPLNDEGQPTCGSYHDIVSDYDKYAWTTANSRSGTNVEIFDLDNGDHVGSFPTCSGPRGFQILPSRNEVWFRCTSPHAGDPDGESGYWDSFSTNSISSHFPEISLNRALPQFADVSYGQPIFIEERGIGYSSDFTNGVLHKVDLDARMPLSNITIPDAYGGWAIGYSPTNGHIFMKTHVCCTCGGPDKDLENCVEYRGGVHADPVFVLTGPSANPTETQIGACGRHCDNSKADVIGVVEIDSNTDTIVGYHKNSIGLGASEVYVSPNGEYIVLVSLASSPANIRLLKPGASGQLSTFYKDIPFPTEGRLGGHAFITSDIIAVTSSDNRNELFLAEISTGSILTITLDTSNINTDSGRGRLMLYIPGSPYLWLSATGPEDDADKFAYVVELNFEDWAQSKVIRKVTGIDVNGMLFVENMKLARDHTTKGSYMAHVDETNSKVDALEQELQTLRSELNSGSTSFSRAGGGNSDDGDNALSIAALVVGVLALLVSAVGFVKAAKKPTDSASTSSKDGSNGGTTTEDYTDKKGIDIETNSQKGSELGSVDNYSMGSKRDQYA